MRHYGLDPNDPQTWLLIKDGRALGGLSAAIDLFPRLSAAYTPLLILTLFPASWQDAAYSAVARRRYRLFGYADLCSIPDETVQSRLITSSETRR